MISRAKRSFALTVAVVLAIVLTSHVSRASDGQAKPRIIDGTLVPQSQFPTVGKIGVIGDAGFCTGTLIAPRFVLLAAHCINNQTAGSLRYGQTEGLFVLGTKSYSTSHMYVHSTYVGDSSQQKEGAIDFAIFELKKASKVPPSLLYRKPPTVGTVVTLVGYGFLGTGVGGSNHDVPPKGQVAMGTTPIDIVTNTFIKWNFDNVPPPNQESNTAPGDSGGPEFVTEGGIAYLAAVTSGGVKNNASFGDLSYNTRVDIATAWIDSITGGPPAAGNHAPVIAAIDSALGVSPGTPFVFTATASDADGDLLHYHWIFGDGTEILDGNAMASRTFTDEGDHLVQLVVTDQKGGSAGRTVPLAVLSSTPPASPLLPATFLKKKFKIGFVESKSDGSLDVTIQTPDIQFADQTAFEAVFTGAVLANIYIGNDSIDSFLGVDSATKRRKSKFDYKKGTFRYSAKSDRRLTPLLNFYGAANATVQTTIHVPVSVEFSTDLFHGGAVYRYGGDVAFAYKGKKGVSGKGN